MPVLSPSETQREINESAARKTAWDRTEQAVAAQNGRIVGRRAAEQPSVRLTTRLLRRLVHSRLRGIKIGHLTVVDGTTTKTFGVATTDIEPVDLHVHDDRFYAQLVFGGSLGAAESYLSGGWDCSNLVDLILASTMYRGNTRVITTAQQMLDELLALRR